MGSNGGFERQKNQLFFVAEYKPVNSRKISFFWNCLSFSPLKMSKDHYYIGRSATCVRALFGHFSHKYCETAAAMAQTQDPSAISQNTERDLLHKYLSCLVNDNEIIITY